MLSFVGSLANVNNQTKNKAKQIADYCQLYFILLDCTLLKANKKRMEIIDTNVFSPDLLSSFQTTKIWRERRGLRCLEGSLDRASRR